jgi:F0F1-type ATP synthase delta subunit
MIDVNLLKQFEHRLNPRHPEQNAKVLGYGEISTVLEIGGSGLAYKRMPMFNAEDEVAAYTRAFDEYVRLLRDEVGIRVIVSELATFKRDDTKRIIAYMAQEKLPARSIGNSLIKTLSQTEAIRLTNAILREFKKVFVFNQKNAGRLALGIDGQFSNWAAENLESASSLPAEIRLIYFDINTPLWRKEGIEQLNTELFLRSAPSFLRWVLRLFFLQDVVGRYYDLRKVCMDLLANLYKEQRPELIPALIEIVNKFFAEELSEANIQALTAKEIEDYYREDAFIWRIYLAFRKIDRALHGVLGKDYPYILPKRVER